MAIRAVFFDVGGVLFHLADKTKQRCWEEQLGLDNGTLGRIIWTMPISAQAEIGQASEDAVWTAVADRFQLSPIGAAALRADFFSGGVWDERLIAYAQALRPRYKTGVISNAWPEARRSIQSYVNATMFDDMIFSAEVGLAKPDRRIYELAVERLHVPPAEAIFIDDVQENIEAAQAIGMVGIRFIDTEQTLTEIEQYLNIDVVRSA